MRMRHVLAVLLMCAGGSVLASDFLTEGVDNGAHRLGEGREDLHDRQTSAASKLLWKLKLESTPRAMHNLFAPLIAEKRHDARKASREIGVVAGVSDDLFGIDVATGKRDLAPPFRQHLLDRTCGRRPTRCVPAGRRRVPTMAQVSPGKYTVYAVSWDGRLRQINLADGQDVAPPEKFMPGGGKPYALNLHDGVDLHGDGAGLRRPDQRVLFLRPRDAPSAAPSFPRAAACGAAAARRSHPKARSISAPATAMFDPSNRRLGNGIVGVKLDDEQAAAARRLLRRAERELAVAARSRRQHDAGGVRLPRPQVPRRHQQGVPAVAARSRRARRRGSSDDAAHHAAHLQRRAGVRLRAASGARSARGRTGRGTQWVLVPFWGPVSKRSSRRRSSTRGPKGGGVAAFKLVERAGKWQLDARLAVARHGPRRRKR